MFFLQWVLGTLSYTKKKKLTLYKTENFQINILKKLLSKNFLFYCLDISVKNQILDLNFLKN